MRHRLANTISVMALMLRSHSGATGQLVARPREQLKAVGHSLKSDQSALLSVESRAAICKATLATASRKS
jgi:hypothetical protein